MPPGSEPDFDRRSDIMKRGGYAAGWIGLQFDIGETFTTLNWLPGDEQALSILDLGVTYISNALLGQNYIVESPHETVPPMLTFSQDEIVTAGDIFLAESMKIGGAALAGDAGYSVGLATDAVTSLGSAVYDGFRLFGGLKNYVNIGVTLWGNDNIDIGTPVIIVWPDEFKVDLSDLPIWLDD